MCLEQKRRHHAEVSATSADGPEQVTILVGARNDKSSIGQDDVGRQQIVDGQAVLSRQVSHAAAEGQASNAGRRDDSRRHSESKCMRCVVNIAPGATAPHAHSPCRGIDMNVLDEGEIDDQAVVADSQASGVMAPASNRNPQILLPAETNGGNYVGHVGALGDQARFTANHGVIHFALFLVARVGGLDQIAPELTFEFSDSFLLHSFLHIRKNIADSISTLRWETFRNRSPIYYGLAS
jgi:hypothetical protein